VTEDPRHQAPHKYIVGTVELPPCPPVQQLISLSAVFYLGAKYVDKAGRFCGGPNCPCFQCAGESVSLRFLLGKQVNPNILSQEGRQFPFFEVKLGLPDRSLRLYASTHVLQRVYTNSYPGLEMTYSRLNVCLDIVHSSLM
jgi:hypothetical protein